MSFDVQTIRRDFPILDSKVYGRPLCYLDNAATTQLPAPVMDVLIEQHRFFEANVHRGIHFLSETSTQRMEKARKTAAEFLNASEPCEIIFTSGTTESINLAARSFGETFIQQGDTIVTTAMEHHSNLVPWQEVCKRQGAELRVVPFDEKGNLKLDALDEYLAQKPKIVAVCAVSNVLGTVNPLKTIIEKAHASGAKVLIDAAQGVRHGKIDVQALDCDFLAFSGHKIMGPTGTGILYGKKELLSEMHPVCFGGGMVDIVTEQHTTYGELPFKFEAGTPNIAGNIVLGAALEYYMEIRDESEAYEAELLSYAENELRKIPEVKIIGAPSERSGVISFNVDGMHYYDCAALLDKLGVAVRSGHHCAMPLLKCFGITGAVRVSPAYYNTKEEIDAMINGLNRILLLVKGKNS